MADTLWRGAGHGDVLEGGVDHGEGDQEEVGPAAVRTGDDLLGLPGEQFRGDQTRARLAHCRPVAQIISAPQFGAAVAGPVVDSAAVGTEEGIEAAVGWGVAQVAVAEVPLAQ